MLKSLSPDLLKEVAKYKLSLRLAVGTHVSFHVNIDRLIEVFGELLGTPCLQGVFSSGKICPLAPIRLGTIDPKTDQKRHSLLHISLGKNQKLCINIKNSQI